MFSEPDFCLGAAFIAPAPLEFTSRKEDPTCLRNYSMELTTVTVWASFLALGLFPVWYLPSRFMPLSYDIYLSPILPRV